MFFWLGPHTQKVAHHWSKETFLQNWVQITKMGTQPKYILLHLGILHLLISAAVLDTIYNISQSNKYFSLIHFWKLTFFTSNLFILKSSFTSFTSGVTGGSDKYRGLLLRNTRYHLHLSVFIYQLQHIWLCLI